jgi:hypothetical protein
MAKLGFRERTLLPDGKFFRFRILSAELEVKVIGGEHGGHIFTDWSKLGTDEDTGEVFVVEDGKAEEIFTAAGVDPLEADTDALVGKTIMARAGVSENGKRNRLEYGSIGPVLEGEEDAKSEYRRAHEKVRKASAVTTESSGYVEDEDEPLPEES